MHSSNMPEQVDLLVIGGGVNGAGIAADAAGRGLSVLLCEQDDLASGTSSASTKLIHGGLRYLETWQFRLVRESLQEREVLLRAAPHIVSPLCFRLPHHPGLRPAWMIRAGLFLYDHLSRRVTLPPSRGLKFGASDPLNEMFRRGFEYSDCWVDDARLVVLNALQAQRHGAVIKTAMRCAGLQAAQIQEQKAWCVRLHDVASGTVHEVLARCAVNVTGPWVQALGEQLLPQQPPQSVRLVKGSHIVVPRIYSGNEAYLLQNSDGRVVFVIPYEGDYSLIGTTEQDYSGDPALAGISAGEIDYLLNVVKQYFRNVPDTSQVSHHFSGIRPLLDGQKGGEPQQASKVSRDYHIELTQQPAPLVTVYGGKITTYRRLAESVMQQLIGIFPTLKGSWTGTATLPGGDFDTRSGLLSDLLAEYPWASESQMHAWVKRYGTMTRVLLSDAKSVDDLGKEFTNGLYEREVQYLCEHEWARTAEDVLWRRSKLGLRFNTEQKAALQDWMGRRRLWQRDGFSH